MKLIQLDKMTRIRFEVDFPIHEASFNPQLMRPPESILPAWYRDIKKIIQGINNEKS